MTLPGGPQQHGPQGWQPPTPQQGQQPYPQQYPQQPQQYPPQPGMPWGPPPPRGRKGGVLIGILVTVLVLGLAFAGYWVFYEMDDSSETSPPVDASQDLDKAPIGCAMLDEEEVALYIPGRMDYEPGSANPGTQETHDQGQCDWSNSGTFTEDNVRPAFVIVTSYVYHANHELSGVDKAKEHLESRVRNGVAVNVPDADEAQLVQTADHSATVTVRYYNVVYDVDYSNQTEGANVKGAATELATIALSKVVAGD